MKARRSRIRSRSLVYDDSMREKSGKAASGKRKGDHGMDNHSQVCCTLAFCSCIFYNVGGGGICTKATALLHRYTSLFTGAALYALSSVLLISNKF